MEPNLIHKNNCAILSFDSLPSTQKYCLENLNAIKDKCDVLHTKKQTNGIGRNATNWLYFDGICTFSVILHNADSKLLQHRVLNIICEILNQDYKVDAYIKWPNDVYILNSKICGIIVDVIDNISIVGIGINLTGSYGTYTSIEQLVQIKIDQFEFIDKLMQYLMNDKQARCNYLKMPNKVRYNGEEMSVKANTDMSLQLTDDALCEYTVDSFDHSYDILNNEIHKKAK